MSKQRTSRRLHLISNQIRCAAYNPSVNAFNAMTPIISFKSLVEPLEINPIPEWNGINGGEGGGRGVVLYEQMPAVVAALCFHTSNTQTLYICLPTSLSLSFAIVQTFSAKCSVATGCTLHCANALALHKQTNRFSGAGL